MAKPTSKPARSPHLDTLAKIRGEIRALSAGIESHLNLHAAQWNFAARAADARRLADLFLDCAEAQAAHNTWEQRRDGTPEPTRRGHWMVLRNGVEPVDYGTSFEDAGERMRKAADTAEQLLRIRYGKARIILRAGNSGAQYVDVMTEDGEGLLQREWFELQNVAR